MINGVGSSSQTRIGQAKDSGKIGVTTETAAVSATDTETGAKPMTLIAALAEAGPPINAEKIQAIRAAIAQGRYPLDPKAIAQKMLDLDLPKGSA
jgi:negative regulator of flagellin synthesis FlgM